MLRLAFFALLAGGLVWWGQRRGPRELRLELDLTAALPGEVSEIDVIAERDGHPLARQELRYGPQGAPGLVQTRLRAPPGEAEIEVTIVYAGGKPPRRTRVTVRLDPDRTARIAVR